MSNLKKESVKEINDLMSLFPPFQKSQKWDYQKKTIPLTFVPSHRHSLFTLRNKLMGLKGIEHSQEIFHPAITCWVTAKMVIFTPIWDASAPNHMKGGFLKVWIINL